MCFYALAADFAAGAVAPALTLMQYQFVTHESISRLTQLVAVSTYLRVVAMAEWTLDT
jgi:hypothetical protein